jgi:hyperosmotically inducible protein
MSGQDYRPKNAFSRRFVRPLIAPRPPIGRPGGNNSARFARASALGPVWHITCRSVAITAKSPHQNADKNKKEKMAMQCLRHLRLLPVAMLVMLTLAACSSGIGKTAGESIDDATITTQVKAKLAKEKVSTLTKVEVDTNHRTVYLNGLVDSEDMKQRASSIAWSVKGVNAVVNHLAVKTSG